MRQLETVSSGLGLVIGEVAQLVEQRPFKPWVAGSSPALLTTLPSGAASRESEQSPLKATPQFFRTVRKVEI